MNQNASESSSGAPNASPVPSPGSPRGFAPADTPWRLATTESLPQSGWEQVKAVLAPVTGLALKIHHTVTRVLTVVLVFISFFVAMGPLSFWLKLTRNSALGPQTPTGDSFWLSRQSPEPADSPAVALKRFRKQF